MIVSLTLQKSMPDQTLTVELTAGELDAVRALAQGLAALRERQVTEADAVVAAVEHGLAHLLDGYDLPADDRAVVERGLEAMRSPWVRGNCCL
jgi:hypothetical protein